MKLDRAEVERLTKLGYSASHIAMRLDCAERSVTRVRRELGLSQSVPNCAPASVERLAQAKALLDDGAPYQEVTRTLHMAWETLVKHFPGYAWSHQEASAMARMTQKLYGTPEFNRYRG